MGATLLIAATAVVVYVCRLSGFVLAPLAFPSRTARFLRYVPIAVFSALLSPSLTGDLTHLPLKLTALAAAGLVVRRNGHIGLAVVVGMGVFWLLVR